MLAEGGSPSPDNVASVSWRGRALAETLADALSVAPAAGVTRLGDITGLDITGLPVFQAIRPEARCLSVTLGKGLSRRAAMVSALMEAIETSAAENVRAEGSPVSVRGKGPSALALWSGGSRRGIGGIDLDPDAPREWVFGREFESGAPTAVPLDLVSLDFVRPVADDIFQTSIGLASGNSPSEAKLAAFGEIVEHDLDAQWRLLAGRERSRCEVDIAGIDDPVVAAALWRIAASGRRARLWSIGQDHRLPAFECMISDSPYGATVLPPVRGTACHPSRRVAALAAILEAAQGHPALIAGARDDLGRHDYVDGQRRSLAMLLGTFGFEPARLSWSDVPDPRTTVDDGAALLLDYARARSTLPVIAVDLPQPHPRLHVVKLVAPGLAVAGRLSTGRKRSAPVRLRGGGCDQRRLLFAGPSIAGLEIPAGLEVRPPAVAGAFAALLDHPPAAVGLIDGCFEEAPSVWHKEMLDLSARGTVVFGAASLGALRAAELGLRGIRGIGMVYRLYSEGLVQRDDAVMVTHAPAGLGHRALTVALIDVEAALLLTLMPAAERRALQRIARTMSFRERSWRALLERYAERAGRRASVGEDVLAAMPSLKRCDAAELLQTMAGPLPPAAPRSRPPITRFYRALLRECRTTPPRHPPAPARGDAAA